MSISAQRIARGLRLAVDAVSVAAALCDPSFLVALNVSVPVLRSRTKVPVDGRQRRSLSLSSWVSPTCGGVARREPLHVSIGSSYRGGDPRLWTGVNVHSSVGCIVRSERESSSLDLCDSWLLHCYGSRSIRSTAMKPQKQHSLGPGCKEGQLRAAVPRLRLTSFGHRNPRNVFRQE